MGRTGVIVTGLVGVALAIGVALAVANNDNESSTNTSNNGSTSKTTDQTAGTGANTSPDEAVATISYNSSLFSPSQVTVKAGDTIAIKNDSSEEIDLRSDPHPVHTANPELNIGLVVPGEIKTFKVTAKGSFGYHNHLDPNQTGTIVVN